MPLRWGGISGQPRSAQASRMRNLSTGQQGPRSLPLALIHRLLASEARQAVGSNSSLVNSRTRRAVHRFSLWAGELSMRGHAKHGPHADASTPTRQLAGETGTVSEGSWRSDRSAAARAQARQLAGETGTVSEGSWRGIRGANTRTLTRHLAGETGTVSEGRWRSGRCENARTLPRRLAGETGTVSEGRWRSGRGLLAVGLLALAGCKATGYDGDPRREWWGLSRCDSSPAYCEARNRPWGTL